jgi:adenylate cyclase
MNESTLQKTIHWLLSGAHPASTPAELMAEICERLLAADLPLWRAASFVQTLHPDGYGRSFVWHPQSEMIVKSADFDFEETSALKQSPIAFVRNTNEEFKCRLDRSSQIDSPFPTN